MIKTAICLFLLFTTSAMADSFSDENYAGQKGPIAQTFLPNDDFQLGMSAEYVEAIIRQKYRNWTRTEGRKTIRLTRNINAGNSDEDSYQNSIKLEIKRELNGWTLSEIYKLHFTSPLSGGVVYAVSRDLTFPDLNAEDGLAYSGWLEALQSTWGEPHFANRSGKSGNLSAFYFYDSGGKTPPTAGERRCTSIFEMISAVNDNASGDADALVALIESEGCHFLIQSTVAVSEKGFIDEVLTRQSDMYSYAQDLRKRVAAGAH